MAALWTHGPLSFVSLIEAVKATQPWGDATIKTLLHRLVQKGAVKSIKEDGRQRYHALLRRDAYVAGEVGDLVDRLFCGDVATLKAFLDDPPA